MRQKMRQGRSAWMARQYSAAVRAGKTTREARRAGSWDALARLIGTTSQSLMNWEQGKTTPRADFAVRMARLYGYSVEELLEDV